jgi:hypothetical protein
MIELVFAKSDSSLGRLSRWGRTARHFVFCHLERPALSPAGPKDLPATAATQGRFLALLVNRGFGCGVGEDKGSLMR